MTKLGSGRLGSRYLGSPDDETALTDPGAGVTGPRERANENMKTAFPTAEGTTWDKTLTTWLQPYEEEQGILETVYAQRFVQTATDTPLEKIGDLFDLDRRKGETDNEYRRRIMLQLPAYTGGGTIDDVVGATTTLLECHPADVRLEEPFEMETGRFDVFIDEQAVTNSDATVNEVQNLLQLVKAAGVRCVATIGKQFSYRSEGEFNSGINDPERGYASESDPNMGGPWADLVTAKLDDTSLESGFGTGPYGDGAYGH